MRASSFDISRLLDRDGVISRREHPELATALSHLARNGQLKVVLPGVFARPEAAAEFDTRVLALNHYDPNAILTGRAAARLGYWKDLKVPVVTAACKNARTDQRGYEFSQRVISDEFVVRRQGSRLMCPALAALDLCGDMDGDGIDAVFRERAATLEQLHHAVDAVRCTRGQRHRRQLLLESRAEPWSAAERKLHELLRQAGITGWRGNLELWIRGKKYYPDVAFVASRLIVEVDSKEFHGPETFETDRERQNRLVLDGWTILRFTWAMLEGDPDGVVELIREALGRTSESASRIR